MQSLGPTNDKNVISLFSTAGMPLLPSYNDEVINPHTIRISGLLPASCLAVRNDGDLYRHHSFLQGIFTMPAARNDDTCRRHCEARSNPGHRSVRQFEIRPITNYEKKLHISY